MLDFIPGADHYSLSDSSQWSKDPRDTRDFKEDVKLGFDAIFELNSKLEKLNPNARYLVKRFLKLD